MPRAIEGLRRAISNSTIPGAVGRITDSLMRAISEPSHISDEYNSVPWADIREKFLNTDEEGYSEDDLMADKNNRPLVSDYMKEYAGGFGGAVRKLKEIMYDPLNSLQKGGFLPGAPGIVSGLLGDVQELIQIPESRTALNMGLMGGGNALAIATGGILPASIVKAYHGTPHKVDKFEMDKIGTGEGSQSYGHGLYFAENPDVAGQYKNALEKPSITLDGVSANPFTNDIPQGLDHDAIFYAVRDGDAISTRDVATADWFNANKDRLGMENKGNLYNVNLDVNKEDLLDWDAPLSKQPKKVKESLEPYLDMKFDSGQSLREVDARGDQIYDMIVSGETVGSGTVMDAHRSNSSAASQKLKEAGIPGIKYFDGNSRKAGEGTHNIVMFDENLIDIDNY
jgi:hypothetical protein